MELFVQSLLFGLTVVGILVGLIGILVPVLPGPLLIFLSIFGYAYYTQWQDPQLWVTVVLLATVVVTGTSEWWLPYFGAAKVGESKRASVYGFVGGVVGMFFGFIFGSIAGYALGVLLGTYQKHGDMQKALKASVAGVAGQGTAMVVQFAGGATVLFFFVKTVLHL